MKYFLMVLILQGIIFSYATAFALPPAVSENVPVLQNATPAQCPSSFRGRVGAEDVEVISRFGGDTGTSGAGVRTCTGCAIDPSSQACVCKTCYDYFN
ncbi:MAG: hypothetical protein EPO11_08650 [Gammaproteobacteria bacterium]|nr:MAG: hypothetical protein EPO11_08650 [Gammaproteobacteria bacterium]